MLSFGKLKYIYIDIFDFHICLMEEQPELSKSMLSVEVTTGSYFSGIGVLETAGALIQAGLPGFHHRTIFAGDKQESCRLHLAQTIPETAHLFTDILDLLDPTVKHQVLEVEKTCWEPWKDCAWGI